MVLRQDHIAARSVTVQGHMQVFRPRQRIAYLGAAQRAQVVHVVGGVLGQVQRALGRKIEMHFRRRLGFGRELELDLDAVDHVHLVRLADGHGGRDQARRRARHGLAQAGIDLAIGTLGQRGAELELRAAGHGRAANHVLRYRVLHEARRRDHLHFTRVDLRLRHQASDTAVVVAVAVAVHHGVQSAFVLWVAVLAVQGERRRGSLRAGVGVECDQAGIALDEGDVGDVEAAHLEHARRDLEQTVDAVQARLAPQAGVDGGSTLFLVQKAIGALTPYDMAVAAQDLRVIGRADEAALRVGPVLAIFLRQVGGDQAMEVNRWLVGGGHGCLRCCGGASG